MQDAIKTISFRELKWDDVDNYANKHGFKDRSPFIEYCVAKTIHKEKFYNKRVLDIVILLMLAFITLLLLVGL